MQGDTDTSESGHRGAATEPDNRASEVPPIAGFWRRVVAFLIDSIALGLVGQVLGWSLSDLWFEIGPFGRIVGQGIGLAYFGVMGSRLAGGSTLGKRVMGLAVGGLDGRPIGILRSLVRTFVWGLPLTLNGWALPIMANPVVSWVATVVVLGVGGAIALTMAFHRRGLHDLLTDTYVFRVNAPPVAALPRPGRGPWVLSAGTLTVAVILAGVVPQLILPRLEGLQNLVSLQQKLQRDGRFFSVGVFDNTVRQSGGKANRMLRVQVWYKGVPTETMRATLMNEVAAAALTMPDAEKFDFIRVEVVSAYDLGIAKGSLNHGDSQPATVWKERVDRERHPAAS